MSESKRLLGRISGLLGSLNEIGGCHLDQLCRAVDLIKAPHNPKAKTHKLMRLGTLLANGQSIKQRVDFSLAR